jgi:hypothetical protein
MTQAKENEVEALNVRRAVGPQQLLVYVFHGHLIALTFQTHREVTIHTAITADDWQTNETEEGDSKSFEAKLLMASNRAHCSVPVCGKYYLFNKQHNKVKFVKVHGTTKINELTGHLSNKFFMTADC